MTKSFLKIFFIIFSLSNPIYANDVNFFYKMFEKIQNELLKKLKNQSTKSIESELQCKNFYRPLHGKINLRIDYYAGYADNIRDLIRDPIEIRALRAFLLTPCGDNLAHQNCGFSLNSNNPFILTKDIKNINSSYKSIEIRFHDSALTTSDSTNRSSPAQILKSELTRKFFINSVKETDLLIYSGHSRFGGGPDFFPEKFLPNGAEDIISYRSEKKGLNDILQGLQSRSDKPFLFFIGSCDSAKHFGDFIAKHPMSPNNLLLSNDSIIESEFYVEFLNLLNNLLNNTCMDRSNTHSNKFTLF